MIWDWKEEGNVVLGPAFRSNFKGIERHQWWGDGWGGDPKADAGVEGVGGIGVPLRRWGRRLRPCVGGSAHVITSILFLKKKRNKTRFITKIVRKIASYFQVVNST